MILTNSCENVSITHSSRLELYLHNYQDGCLIHDSLMNIFELSVHKVRVSYGTMKKLLFTPKRLYIGAYSLPEPTYQSELILQTSARE